MAFLCVNINAKLKNFLNNFGQDYRCLNLCLFMNVNQQMKDGSFIDIYLEVIF